MPASGGVPECTSQHRRLITQCTRVKRLAFITRGRDHSSNRRRYVENTLSLRIIRAQQCRRLPENSSPKFFAFFIFFYYAIPPHGEGVKVDGVVCVCRLNPAFLNIESILVTFEKRLFCLPTHASRRDEDMLKFSKPLK